GDDAAGGTGRERVPAASSMSISKSSKATTAAAVLLHDERQVEPTFRLRHSLIGAEAEQNAPAASLKRTSSDLLRSGAALTTSNQTSVAAGGDRGQQNKRKVVWEEEVPVEKSKHEGTEHELPGTTQQELLAETDHAERGAGEELSSCSSQNDKGGRRYSVSCKKAPPVKKTKTMIITPMKNAPAGKTPMKRGRKSSVVEVMSDSNAEPGQAGKKKDEVALAAPANIEVEPDQLAD
ncbi:unnamed protein product, partial [Amoebophrya sp. A120]